MNGFGELAPRNYARNFGMGGTGIGMAGEYGVDPVNPGHYGNLKEPSFEMGVLHQRYYLTDGTEEELKKSTDLQNIAFGFPASDRWTLSFGIQPFSHRFYDIRDTLEQEGIGEYAHTYQGKGRIQRLFVGNGYNIIQQGDSLTLGIGFHMNYLFGTIEDQRTNEFESSAVFNNEIKDKWSFSEFLFDVGVHFQKRIGLHPRKRDEEEMVPLQLMAGLTVDLPQTVTPERSFLSRTYGPEGRVKDTVRSLQDESYPMDFPLGIGGGIALKYDEKLTLTFDHRIRPWSSGKKNEEHPLFSEGPYDRSETRAGLEYIPKNEYSQRASYFSYASYRLGARSIAEYSGYNGQQIQDLGISFGVGFPLVRSSSSYSMLNIGAEWGERGASGGGGLEEEFWRFSVGVSLSPHRADQWFRKPKIR